MFDIRKVTEIFCICDDFSKKFDATVIKKSLDTPKYRGCGKRRSKFSDAEIMTVLILFHTNT